MQLQTQSLKVGVPANKSLSLICTPDGRSLFIASPIPSPKQISLESYCYQGFKYWNVNRIGFEPMTCCLEGSCSIQLSYRSNKFLRLKSAKLRILSFLPGYFLSCSLKSAFSGSIFLSLQTL